MRVLLQNTETKLYFIIPNEWTNDPLKATDFEEIENAEHVYLTQDLTYAQIILEPGSAPARPQVASELLRRVQPQN